MSVLRKDFYDDFARIPNELILDNRLSNGAFRVLCLLFSKPNNWKVYNKAIMRELGIKKTDTLSAYWKECLASGWLERVKITEEKDGTIGAYNYSINLSPKMVGIPEDGTPEKRDYPKNGEHNNTNSLSNTNYNQELFEELWKSYTLGFLKKQGRNGGSKGKALKGFLTLIEKYRYSDIEKLVDNEKSLKLGNRDLERVLTIASITQFMEDSTYTQELSNKPIRTVV